MVLSLYMRTLPEFRPAIMDSAISGNKLVIAYPVPAKSKMHIMNICNRHIALIRRIRTMHNQIFYLFQSHKGYIADYSLSSPRNSSYDRAEDGTPLGRLL